MDIWCLGSELWIFQGIWFHQVLVRICHRVTPLALRSTNCCKTLAVCKRKITLPISNHYFPFLFCFEFLFYFLQYVPSSWRWGFWCVHHAPAGQFQPSLCSTRNWFTRPVCFQDQIDFQVRNSIYFFSFGYQTVCWLACHMVTIK